MIKISRILLTLLLLLAGTGAYAQIGEPRNQLSVGVSAGLAMNSVDFDPTIKQVQHMGPTIGVALKYTSEKYFTTYCSLYGELNYTQLGWKEDILDVNSKPLPDTYQRNISYLQLPLFARLSWGKEAKGAQFFFQAGPQFGLCVGESSSKSDVWTLDKDGHPSRPNNMYAQYDMDVEHKFDYGIVAGAGLEINTSAGHFIAEGRYYYGLADMFGNSKKDVFARSANTTICIKVAYLFDLKK